MSLSDLQHIPLGMLIIYLKKRPDFMGEAVAKMAYQELTRRYQNEGEK